MQPSNNNVPPSEMTTNSIINGINPKSGKNECNVIGTPWKKKCPNCDGIQSYTSNGNLNRAIKKNCLCDSCNSTINRRTKNNEFIHDCQKVHGNKYDYSITYYKGAHEKVSILCLKHGEFHQRANNHILGVGCPTCTAGHMHFRFVKSISEFIGDCIKMHGMKYDYSKVVYYNDSVKIEIICPLHGTFWQSPNKHLFGQGCPSCKYQISKLETEWLDYMKIKVRGFQLPEWKQKIADGYDKMTHTIYEFLGDYWHGNPSIYDFSSIHPKRKRSYGEIYQETFVKLNKTKNLGYVVKYIWESDWKQFKSKLTSTLKINTL